MIMGATHSTTQLTYFSMHFMNVCSWSPYYMLYIRN